MAPLTNKRVIIIGASAGLGFGVAKAALEEGAHVVICSSNKTRLEAAARELGGGDKLSTDVVDLTSEDSIKAFFDKSGKFEHLVITAGDSLPPIKFPETSLDNISGLFQVRFTAVLLCAKYAQGHVTESITTTSGSSAVKALPGWAVASGLAAAVVASTRGLALDLAPLRVNCIAPGLVATSMWDNMPEDARKAMYENAAARSTVKRVATADDIADAYIFAMKCSHITGETIHVNGGALLV